MGEEKFKLGDKVIREGLHGQYEFTSVIRTTKTQAVLANGQKVAIDGVDGTRHIKNYSNQHMVHYWTYYRLPNDAVEKRAERYLNSGSEVI